MSARRVLIVVLDNLGDLVMATGVAGALRRAIPGVELGLWSKAYASGLVEPPVVDRVHASDPFWDGAPGRGPGGVGAFVATVREIRAARYDSALVLNAEWRRAAACRWAGIRERVGFNRRKSGLFLTTALPAASVPPHFVDQHRALLEAWLGSPIPAETALPRLTVAPADDVWWRTWSRSAHLTGRFVAVSPFTGDPLKNWPLAAWEETLGELARRWRDRRFVLVGGARDRGDADRLAAAVPRAQAFCGEPLGRVKALLRRASLVIGSDTGPGHVAAALGVPVVALFGPTDPGRCAPRGSAPVRVLRQEPITALRPAEVVAEAHAFAAALLETPSLFGSDAF